MLARPAILEQQLASTAQPRGILVPLSQRRCRSQYPTTFGSCFLSLVLGAGERIVGDTLHHPVIVLNPLESSKLQFSSIFEQNP